MKGMFSITGKKAMITGGTRGLGRGMAEALMEAGAETVIFGSNTANPEILMAEWRSKGLICHGVTVDLGRAEARENAFTMALELLGGKVDILVNCAGIQRRHLCEDFPLDDWQDVLEVNLTATFDLCQRAGRVMLGQGRGKIINIASMLSFFGGFTVPAYAASKGAVAQLTKALSNEWAGKGVQVNALAPGYMNTDMNTALVNDEHRNAEILARIPAHRWGTSDDMKGPLLFLASAASNYLSGAVIPVDGGYLGR